LSCTPPRLGQAFHGDYVSQDAVHVALTEEAGLEPGPIEEAEDYFIMRIRDPDQNLVVFASAKKS
jgi:hypothetical protein